MKQDAHQARHWRTGAALIAVGLAAGCTIYQPLDRGSRVPWARAEPAGPDGAAVALVASPPAVSPLWNERYRVRRGDRLGDLAQSFDVRVAELAQANGLNPPYVIRTGQELRVPSPAPAVPSERAFAARAPIRSQSIVAAEAVAPPPAPEVAVESERTELAAVEVMVPLPPEDGPVPKAKPVTKVAPEPKEPGPNPVSVAVADRYTVGSGDTLSGIARELGVGMVDLARANDLETPYRVYAGQKLRVPNGQAPQTTTVRLGDDEGSVRLATGKPPPLRGDDFVWPVNGKVIGAFGPIDQYRRRDGIDIAARRGAPVLAAQDGIVAYAGDGIPGYGQMILLRHDEGYITTYAHNATLLVNVGEVVERGQVIARVGDSGDATQSMLHFELRKGRTPIDPETRLVSLDTDVASATQ
jgi:murein DD-endopeptidase MepM/ murein hydrolase activator NlpD